MRDRALGSTIRIYFTTHTLSTGVVVAPSSALAAADFRIYKDGSATEKATANGVTVTSPFDSVAGTHLIEIDTSNTTGDSGFWASGSSYRVVINTAKTVDSKNPSGVCVGEFSLELQTADVRKFGGSAGTFTSGKPTVELDPDITDQLDSIENGVDANTGYLTSLLSRLTANAATAIQNLYHMITGTGADSKFTESAFENAPEGLTEDQDELLTTIGQRTAQITGSRLSVAGPITPGGQISLVVGSDYVDDIDSSLIRTVTDAGETLHDALTAGELSELRFSAAPKSNAPATNKITGTVAAVSHAGGVTSITIEIARANIPNGSYDEDWKYQIWRTTDDHVSPPLLEGQLLLHWRS